jgi:hypothetical protein
MTLAERCTACVVLPVFRSGKRGSGPAGDRFRAPLAAAEAIMLQRTAVTRLGFFRRHTHLSTRRRRLIPVLY